MSKTVLLIVEQNQTYEMHYDSTGLLWPGLVELQALNISEWIYTGQALLWQTKSNQTQNRRYNSSEILQSQLLRGLTAVIHKVIIHRTRDDFRVKSTSTQRGQTRGFLERLYTASSRHLIIGTTNRMVSTSTLLSFSVKGRGYQTLD